MALQVSRFCKLPTTFGVTRLLLQDCLVRSSRRSLPVTSVAAAVRPYSSNRGDQKPNHRVAVFGLTNPFIWIRTRIFCFLIRAYFDSEFSIEEFTEGAKQAFCHVSSLLSKCQFSALEGLVAQDLIGKLEEKCNLLPSDYKSALYAEPEDIMFTTASDVGFYYDDEGRKFVSILMRFWYMTSTSLPDDSLEGTKMFKVTIGDIEGETKRLLTANYEFQREFTKGVEPDWTITRIEHSKLLD